MADIGGVATRRLFARSRIQRAFIDLLGNLLLGERVFLADLARLADAKAVLVADLNFCR
jgi:hypothetical protein